MRYFLNKLEKITKCLMGLKFLGQWKVLFVLSILLGSLGYTSLYYFQPQIEELKGKQDGHILRQLQDKNKLKPARLVECLAAFAKIDNPDIWIHTIGYKEGQIDLVTHSSNIKSIDEYIDAVSNLADMFILNKEIKEKDAKSLSKEKKAAPKMSYAMYIYQKNKQRQLEKARKNKEEASDDVKENIPDFTYEATIKLKI